MLSNLELEIGQISVLKVVCFFFFFLIFQVNFLLDIGFLNVKEFKIFFKIVLSKLLYYGVTRSSISFLYFCLARMAQWLSDKL